MGDAAQATGFSSSQGLQRASLAPAPCSAGASCSSWWRGAGWANVVPGAPRRASRAPSAPGIVKTVRRDHINDGSFLARFLDEARGAVEAQAPRRRAGARGRDRRRRRALHGRRVRRGPRRSATCASAPSRAARRSCGPTPSRSAIESSRHSPRPRAPGTHGSPLGIVHRDLSPQNVMVGYTGEVKLIDFGTARGHNRRCHTVAGVVFAKPGYVAPEIAPAGGQRTHRPLRPGDHALGSVRGAAASSAPTRSGTSTTRPRARSSSRA